MNRIRYMVIRNFLVVPFFWMKLSYYASHVEKFTKEQHFKLLKKITIKANKGGNVQILTSGVDNIPKESGFALFPNHQGKYDMLAMVAASPIPFSVVAKKELGEISVLNKVFKCMKAFLIDRNDVRQSMEVIKKVTLELINGNNYLIFAEGTRSKKGNEIGEFKGGSFKSAVKAKAPIVPVALIDAFKPFDKKGLDKVIVKVSFLEPLYYEEYKDMKTTEIAVVVEERIKSAIIKLTSDNMIGSVK